MSIWSSFCQQSHENDEELSIFSQPFHHHNEDDGDDLGKGRKYSTFELISLLKIVI
jgi:hypothetical protein